MIKMKMKLMLALAFLTGMGSLMAAEGDPPTVSELWGALNLNFGTQMTQVFTAMATPVGVVVTVVFVMAVFWFCIRMAKNAVNKRNGL